MKRSISGIIRSELSLIQDLQFQGYDLNHIHQHLLEKHELDFNLNTFIVCLYRARKGEKISNLEKPLNIKSIKNAKSIEEINDKDLINKNKENKTEIPEIPEIKATTQTPISTSIPIQKPIQEVISTVPKIPEIAATPVVQIVQERLMIKQVKDIFKTGTDIADFL